MNEERKQVWEIMQDADLEGYTLAQARERLDALIDRYGRNAELVWEEPSYSDGERYLSVRKQRPETDQEMARRLKLESVYAQDREQRERAMYEQLKAKFGDK